MEMKGVLRPSDLFAAEWLRIKPRRSYAIVGVLLLILVAWVLWVRLNEPHIPTDAWVVLACILYLFGYFVIWIPHRVKKIYRQRKGMQREVKISTTESGLLVTTENGHMNIPWSDFRDWKESRSIFLLFLSDIESSTLPKHFFNSENDVDNFREILRNKVNRNDA